MVNFRTGTARPPGQTGSLIGMYFDGKKDFPMSGLSVTFT